MRRLRHVVGKQVRRLQKRRLIAAGGAPPSWYDEAYSGKIDEYVIHYSQSQYLPVWQGICDRMGAGVSVLEVGCGPAQLANMILDRGVVKEYVGFDFSPTAIELARKNIPGKRVEVADARTTDLFDTVNYNTVVCTEVLEHILDDIPVLERIKSGARVLATVPNFDYKSHVRFFTDATKVIDRYGTLFQSMEISEHYHTGDENGSRGIFYLIDGVR